MQFRTLRAAIFIASLSAVGRINWAQSQPAPAAQPPAATNTSSAPASGQTPDATKTKPAKVWNNDDLANLPSDGGVSVVGKNPSSKQDSTASKLYALEKDPAWYRKQLQPLQAEIANLDAQIAKTKAFLAGEKVDNSDAPVVAYFRPGNSPQEQLKQLEAKRDKDSAKVEDLLDLARHNGILPGALR